MQAAGKVWILYPSRSDTIRIYNISDIHWGNQGCHKKKLAEDVQTIADDPRAFWVGGGDYAEFISPADKRWDPECIDEDIKAKDLGSLGLKLTTAIRDIFAPIKHKCLGLCFGNHEYTYMKRNEQGQLHSWLCTELEVPDLGYVAMFQVSFGRFPRVKTPTLVRTAPAHDCGGIYKMVTFMVTHGAGAPNTPGGKINRLVDAMRNFDADVIMYGHLHDKKATRRTTIGINMNGDELVEKRQIGVISGSYLLTYAQGVSGYGEQRLYAPCEIGPSWVDIHPCEPRFSITAEV